MDKLLTDFRNHLNEQDLSPLTIKGYLSDLQHFARWFEQTNGEGLTVQRITPTDVKAYKHFLLAVERRKAGTVNRRLAALAALCKWGRQTKQITSDPTENIKGVAGVPRGPRWLDKHEQHRLLRANADDMIVLPKSDPRISALLGVLPLQLLSYHMSVMRGFDPDFPRNLSKTLTVD